MTREDKIDIYNEVDNFVEENQGEVTHTEIARHFFELGGNNAIRLHSFETDYYQFGLAKIRYVHELQHALRLCGFDKKIII